MTCTVSDRVVTGGEDVTVTAEASPNVASTWTLTYDGQTRNRSGNPVTATFDTDEVDEPTQTTVTATVTQDGGSITCNGTIVLLPRDGDDGDGDDGDGDGNGGGGGDNGGLLPNTGGERLLWLIVGTILVVTGGGVVVASRRREA
jgi:LPXTG-motif cell wall-anchored protein